MFSFLLGNKYLAIAKWIAIAGAVWYIFHTWDKAQNYDEVNAKLTAELACAEHSECASRIAKEKVDADKAVADAQAKAKEDSERQQKENEEKADAEIQKQSQSLSDHYEKLLKIQSVHSASCDEWSKQVIGCPME